MATERITRKKLSEKIGMRYITLQNKLLGRTEFTREEMFAIQNVFSRKIPLEELFAKSTDAAQKGGLS
jgi:hypothetical protein